MRKRLIWPVVAALGLTLGLATPSGATAAPVVQSAVPQQLSPEVQQIVDNLPAMRERAEAVKAKLGLKDNPAQDARSLAQDILTKGAALFDARDAAAMAATYAENAEVIAYSKDNETGALKVDTGRGRADIQKFYADLFKGRSPSARCRNIVEDAHFAGPDLLVIRGTFIIDVADEHPLPFIQVRTRKGDKWLILNLQLFGVATKWAR